MRWPDRATVLASAKRWAEQLAAADRSVIAVGCFGSYARGDCGVGSDLDLVVVYQPPSHLEHWDIQGLPVPTDLLSYTPEQWRHIPEQSPRVARVLNQEVVWLHGDAPQLTVSNT
jgi:predicted nucleotidyltransferase